MDTLLGTAEWLAFTRRYWQVNPVTLDYAPRGSSGPVLRAVLYEDRRGRLLLPPYQPHLPLQFVSTPTNATFRIERQWLDTAQLLVHDMVIRGTRGELTFPPEMTDPRPWNWAFFRVTPRFTNLIDFPFTWAQADRVVRQQANKAERAGYLCTRTDSLADSLTCLAGSQARKGFAYGITLAGLELARQLLGSDALRLYTCYSPNGEPATARVVLHRPGGRALDWMAGTVGSHLQSGATQLLISFMLNDLREAQAIGYNSCGADLEKVAYTKALWGGRVVPQYSVQAFDLKSMKSLAGRMARFLAHQAAARKTHRGQVSGKAVESAAVLEANGHKGNDEASRAGRDPRAGRDGRP